MNEPNIIPIEKLKEEPYATVLCYPRVSKSELLSRIAELQRQGVEALEFSGKTILFNVPVLGKGFVGVAVVAHLKEKRVALKIRRVDADRAGFQHEAKMLSRANSVNVGPALIGVSTNFLLMEFIDGDLLPNWLDKNKNGEKEKVVRVLWNIMEQCRRLDTKDLDHGELSKAPKHVIVNTEQKPFIVDFETASINRKPANVTAICQYLFVGNSIAARITVEILGERDLEKLLKLLRLYKQNRTRGNFEELLRICLVQT